MSAQKLSNGEQKVISSWCGSIKETASAAGLSYGYCRKVLALDYIQQAIKELKSNNNGPGRPTKYTEEIATEIVERLSDGESLVSICRSEEIPERKTIYNWLDSSVKDDAPKYLREFLYRYTRARELQADSFFDEAIDIADDSHKDTVIRTARDGTEYEATNHEVIARSKLMVDTRLKVAAITRPEKYSEKKLMELTGKGGGPVETKKVFHTKEEIEAEMKRRKIPIPKI